MAVHAVCLARRRDDESDGRASGSRGGQVTEDHQRAAHSHTQGRHGDDKADSEAESSAVGRAIAEQPSSGMCHMRSTFESAP